MCSNACGGGLYSIEILFDLHLAANFFLLEIRSIPEQGAY